MCTPRDQFGLPEMSPGVVTAITRIAPGHTCHYGSGVLRHHLIHCEMERPTVIFLQKPSAASSSVMRCAWYCRPRNESTVAYGPPRVADPDAKILPSVFRVPLTSKDSSTSSLP